MPPIASMPYEQLAEKVNAYLAMHSSDGEHTLQSILAARSGETDGQATPRDVVIFVVGTSRDSGLDRMVSYLAGSYSLPISVVSYEVFGMPSGPRILMRELSEFEIRPVIGPPAAIVTVESLCALADSHGIGPPFRALLSAAQRLGLYPRPFRTCIMYAPPSNHTRCLFTGWAIPRIPGTLPLLVSSENFAQFYPVTEAAVQQHLGQAGVRSESPAAVDAFIAALDSFFARIKAGEPGSDTEG